MYPNGGLLVAVQSGGGKVTTLPGVACMHARDENVPAPSPQCTANNSVLSIMYYQQCTINNEVLSVMYSVSNVD